MNQKSYLLLKIQAQGHPLAQLVEQVSYVQMPNKILKKKKIQVQVF